MRSVGAPPSPRDRRRRPATPCRDGGMRREGESTAPLGRLHPLLSIHRCARVDDEDDQGAGAPVADLLAKILTLQVKRGPDPVRGPVGAAPDLVRCRGAHGGVEGDVGGLLGLRRPDIAAALVAALRRAPLAGRRTAPAIAGQRDLAHREDLALEELLGAPRVTAWVACSLPCTWPGLSPSSPLPKSSGGWSPASEVCSDTTAASASWAISSKRSRARSAAAPAGWETPS